MTKYIVFLVGLFYFLYGRIMKQRKQELKGTETFQQKLKLLNNILKYVHSISKYIEDIRELILEIIRFIGG